MIQIAKDKIRRQMGVIEGNNNIRKKRNKQIGEKTKEKTKYAKIECDSTDSTGSLKDGKIGGML